MIFTFNFNKNLDLSQFIAQATRYVSSFKEITYHLNLKNYKVVCTTNQDTNYKTSFYFTQIKRDTEGDIINGNNIIPLSDYRFKDLKEISSKFAPDSYIGESEQASVEQVVSFYCKLITFLNKVDKLSVFI